MSTNLPLEITQALKKPFQYVLSTENFGDVVNDIAEEISLGQLTSESLTLILKEYNTNVNKIKDQVLNMILSYTSIILKDNWITEFEAATVKFLKRFFHIEEGDFYNKRYIAVEDVLSKQFEYMYLNNKIDSNEALLKVELQSVFDLSYDQFLQLSKRAVLKAIERGADVMELDTYIKAE